MAPVVFVLSLRLSRWDELLWHSSDTKGRPQKISRPQSAFGKNGCYSAKKDRLSLFILKVMIAWSIGHYIRWIRRSKRIYESQTVNDDIPVLSGSSFLAVVCSVRSVHNSRDASIHCWVVRFACRARNLAGHEGGYMCLLYSQAQRTLTTNIIIRSQRWRTLASTLLSIGSEHWVDAWIIIEALWNTASKRILPLPRRSSRIGNFFLLRHMK